MASSYRLELNKWLNELDVDASKVLDIGGSQEQVINRVKSWNVEEYLIADLDNPHKGEKPDIILDLNEDIITADYCGYFDLIFCLEVFEYIYDPMFALDSIYDALKEGGTAYISFPSIYPLHEPVEDDCLRYMPAGIRKLASETKLEIKNIIPRKMETTSWLDTIIRERFRAAKNQDHLISGWIVEFEK